MKDTIVAATDTVPTDTTWVDNRVKDALTAYFRNYQSEAINLAGRCRLTNFYLNDEDKTLDVTGNDIFAAQPFTPQLTEQIYHDIRQALPEPYNHYKLTVFGGDYPIEKLILNTLNEHPDVSRTWAGIAYRGVPWVQNTSKPIDITNGLQNRHLTVWASHGRYYKNDVDDWRWQRPFLFCTTEDLLTQTFVVPYLIPMLENAGAIVFTPRERDWQRNEAVVDNDTPNIGGTYDETGGNSTWTNTAVHGFARPDSVYLLNGENPFIMGTARQTVTTKKGEKAATASWTPNFPADGQYAVYVSYQTQLDGITDARYTVHHKGNATQFRVNQQMGGSTWVYLGTFEFDAGESEFNRVTLSSESNENGLVTADAVRFGGGMGNIARGDSIVRTSGLPRYLEGARYSAQWGGMPYLIYNTKDVPNDYADDINTRSYTENYLCGGSVFMPDSLGLGVPLELSVALHSDAGYSPTGLIGSLSIYTTNYNERRLSTGISRLASRDFGEMLLSGVTHDIATTYGSWTRRYLFDRNYSETRLPNVPSAILEMFSHQNFKDMKYAHDPNFKFTFARAVYKAILRYVCTQHARPYVVQPLPVRGFAAQLNEENNTVTLSWQPAIDPLEESAKPDGYIVYTRKNEGSFDNGVYVNDVLSYTRKIEQNVMYSFRITAVNKGGESFPSETLAAMKAKKNRGTVLIVNGFQRLSAPQVIDTDTTKGFDLRADIGVPYLCTPEYSGAQINFDASKGGKEGSGALGFSGHELQGTLVAGNTFDYPVLHGRAIRESGGHSFASCSSDCLLNGAVQMNRYPIVDLIFGAQKDDGYSILQYKSFTPALQQVVRNYCQQGGNLLVSGAYVASDMVSDEEHAFTADVLKYTLCDSLCHDSISGIAGMDEQFDIFRTPNEISYAVQRPDGLTAVAPATPLFTYISPQGIAAGVAYKGNNYRSIALGFPFESITDQKTRKILMAKLLKILSSQ